MKTTVIADSKTLDIEKTFECGQCFRWNRVPPSTGETVYCGVAGRYPAIVREAEGRVEITSDSPESFWHEFFDLELDYSAADALFSRIPWLDGCVEYGKGIRILRQDPWEALCSFIISQCNNIARIKGIVERFCLLYGEPLDSELPMKDDCAGPAHAFPAPEIVAGLEPADLEPLRAGYRAPYLIAAARSVCSGELDLEVLKKTSAEEARSALKMLPGIGDKVANCAVLFGLHHMEAFPVDVWIRRALEEHFPPDFDPSSLGEMAGLAQQYMFYREREETRTGKKEIK